MKEISIEQMKKAVPESQELQKVIEKYKKEYHETLDDLVGSPEDLLTLEQMAYDAAIGSTEIKEAWKQVLKERSDQRKKLHDNVLYVDEKGLRVGRKEDFLSGENQ